MASTDVSGGTAAQSQSALGVDMKLEVVTIPVSDVERAKRFYGSLGWRLDADFTAGPDIRGVQFTPPHSECSIHFGKGLTAAAPGSADRLILAVSDIEAAREDLIARGVDVGAAYESRPPAFADVPGSSYFIYAEFRDPDGNRWMLQEITSRIPGREWED
jgi:catechol 2,3-dioxygenase-like lactoylglutathione lyase family enzyme